MNLTDRASHRFALRLVPGISIIVLMYAMSTTSRFIPQPHEILFALQTQVQEGMIVSATQNALESILIGFSIAAFTGVIIGILMGSDRLIEHVLDPYLTGLYVVPFAGLIPAFVMWFGTGNFVRIIVVFFFALLPITINTYEGARNAPSGLLEVSQSFGASKPFIMRKVVLPAIIPYVVAGLRLGIGRSVKGLVVTEILISVSGFGQMLTNWSASLQMDGVFSIVIVLMSMGVILTWILRLVEDRVVYWELSEGSL